MNNTTKRFLLTSMLVAILSVVLAAHPGAKVTAQTATDTGTSEPSTPAPTSSLVFTPVATEPAVNGAIPELHIYNYTTYIADDTISNFENLYHVKVTYDTYATSPEMLTKIQGAGTAGTGYD